MKLFIKSVAVISRACGVIAAVLILLAILVVCQMVIMRYLLSASTVWQTEFVIFSLVGATLIGSPYVLLIKGHVNVDLLPLYLGKRGRRILALIAAACCLIYAFLLLKGAWDYWAPFAGFEQTGGRWFPEGFIKTRDQAWYETEQIPMPDWLRFIEPIFNQGEHYEKLPRFIPYAMLPFGVALLMFRLIQATWGIVTGTRDGLIVSHEAEDAIEDVRHMNQGD